MARVPVPDDVETDHLTVAGQEDFRKGIADVVVSVPNARNLHVREDDDGRYVGPPSDYADEVADALGVGDEPETCTVEKADGDVCGRELPCPYHDE